MSVKCSYNPEKRKCITRINDLECPGSRYADGNIICLSTQARGRLQMVTPRNFKKILPKDKTTEHMCEKCSEKMIYISKSDILL